jgi:hypothetical protein
MTTIAAFALLSLIITVTPARTPTANPPAVLPA